MLAEKWINSSSSNWAGCGWIGAKLGKRFSYSLSGGFQKTMSRLNEPPPVVCQILRGLPTVVLTSSVHTDSTDFSQIISCPGYRLQTCSFSLNLKRPFLILANKNVEIIVFYFNIEASQKSSIIISWEKIVHLPRRLKESIQNLRSYIFEGRVITRCYSSRGTRPFKVRSWPKFETQYQGRIQSVEIFSFSINVTISIYK